MTQMSTRSNSPSSQPSMAAAILQRRLERQRFDSADYAMAMQQRQQPMLPPRVRLPLFNAAQVPAPTRLVSDDFSDWVQCEAEPEPESELASSYDCDRPRVPRQQVPRIRLQRFDSADWAIQLHQEKTIDEAEDSVSSVANTVAKLRLERHAFTTCSFVTTPLASQPQHFVKNA